MRGSTASAGKFVVRQTVSCDVSHRLLKAKSIVHFLSAVVEPKDLFVEVGIQMKRLHRNICALQRPLEKRPEILDALRVDVAANVLIHVIHGLVNKQASGIQTLIANVLVG